MSLISSTKVVREDPSEVNTTGFHTFDTIDGNVELFVNVDDHSDGNWILATNFDARGNNDDFASQSGYTAPAGFQKPRSSGDVTFEYENFLSGADKTGKLLQHNPDFVRSSTWAARNDVGGDDNGRFLGLLRPDTKGYEWNEIKIKLSYSGGNDGYNETGRGFTGGYDLFGSSHDGLKINAGTPSGSGEHILDVLSNDSGSDNTNYNINKKIDFGTNDVRDREIDEQKFTTSQSYTEPPWLSAICDEGDTNEGNGYDACYVWIR